jgi:anti-sigma B factor antagonist
MSKTDSRLLVEQQPGGITKISFRDRNILEETSIAQIKDEVLGVIDKQSAPKILIDFSAVEHMSSAALGSLITINNKVRERSGQLRLANIDAQIYEVFVITRLNRVFQIFESTEKATASFK